MKTWFWASIVFLFSTIGVKADTYGPFLNPPDDTPRPNANKKITKPYWTYPEGRYYSPSFKAELNPAFHFDEEFYKKTWLVFMGFDGHKEANYKVPVYRIDSNRDNFVSIGSLSEEIKVKVVRLKVFSHMHYYGIEMEGDALALSKRFGLRSDEFVWVNGYHLKAIE